MFSRNLYTMYRQACIRFLGFGILPCIGLCIGDCCADPVWSGPEQCQRRVRVTEDGALCPFCVCL
jgi:hypothetical protein